MINCSTVRHFWDGTRRSRFPVGRECPPEAPVAPILGRKKRETSEDGGCPAGWLTPLLRLLGSRVFPVTRRPRRLHILR